MCIVHYGSTLVCYPQPKSAVAVEGLKEYIYIEAYKQTHVKQVFNYPKYYSVSKGIFYPYKVVQ